MNSKSIKEKIKIKGIVGDWRKTKSQLEIRITDPASLDIVSNNVNSLKEEGFYMRLFGECDPSNMNPATPNQMKRCDSCYLSHAIYR